eukprot:COSAG06_NODE_2497_length_6757_cov_80.480625_5_plen_119_part_00
MNTLQQTVCSCVFLCVLCVFVFLCVFLCVFVCPELKAKFGLGYHLHCERSSAPPPTEEGGGDDDAASNDQVRKTHFLSHLYIKTIILPRQARDKHKKSSKKVRFSSNDQAARIASVRK